MSIVPFVDFVFEKYRLGFPLTEREKKLHQDHVTNTLKYYGFGDCYACVFCLNCKNCAQKHSSCETCTECVECQSAKVKSNIMDNDYNESMSLCSTTISLMFAQTFVSPEFLEKRQAELQAWDDHKQSIGQFNKFHSMLMRHEFNDTLTCFKNTLRRLEPEYARKAYIEMTHDDESIDDDTLAYMITDPVRIAALDLAKKTCDIETLWNIECTKYREKQTLYRKKTLKYPEFALDY